MDYCTLHKFRYCLNISFIEGGTPGRGSAIFLHCFGPLKPYTGGCAAIPENLMKLGMQTVREDCAAVIDTLENLGGGSCDDSSIRSRPCFYRFRSSCFDCPVRVYNLFIDKSQKQE